MHGGAADVNPTFPRLVSLWSRRCNKSALRASLRNPPTNIRFIPHDRFFTMPDLVKSLLSAKKKVGAYYVQDFWMGIETVEHFDEVLKALSKFPAEAFGEKVS